MDHKSPRLGYRLLMRCVIGVIWTLISVFLLLPQHAYVNTEDILAYIFKLDVVWWFFLAVYWLLLPIAFILFLVDLASDIKAMRRDLGRADKPLRSSQYPCSFRTINWFIGIATVFCLLFFVIPTFPAFFDNLRVWTHSILNIIDPIFHVYLFGFLPLGFILFLIILRKDILFILHDPNHGKMRLVFHAVAFVLTILYPLYTWYVAITSSSV